MKILHAFAVRWGFMLQIGVAFGIGSLNMAFGQRFMNSFFRTWGVAPGYDGVLAFSQIPWCTRTWGAASG